MPMDGKRQTGIPAGVLVAGVVRRFGRGGLAWERNHGAGVTT